MALTQHVTSAIVKAALGAAMDEWSQLIAHANINKWSRYKPVIGNWPTGTSGKYGLNLNTNWDYIKPRGGVYSEPLRAGDFRGYEHDATPPFHLLFFPTGIVRVTYTEFDLDIDPATADLIIEDLGLENWYFVVKVDGTYYSANENLGYRSTDQNASLQIQITGMSSGAHSWSAYIATAKPIGGASPATKLALPAFIDYIIADSFNVDLSVVFDVSYVEAVYGEFTFMATGTKSGFNLNYTCVNSSGTDFTVYFRNPISGALLGTKLTHGDGRMESGSFASSLNDIDVKLS